MVKRRKSVRPEMPLKASCSSQLPSQAAKASRAMKSASVDQRHHQLRHRCSQANWRDARTSSRAERMVHLPAVLEWSTNLITNPSVDALWQLFDLASLA